MIIGFTGTQSGMTDLQREEVKRILQRYLPFEFHHGDCIGADKQANDIVEAISDCERIIVHPPRDDKKRAWCKSEKTAILSSLSYRARNIEILKQSDLLIGVPRTHREEQRGSGTWMTIRYAKMIGLPVIIVWPNGHTTDVPHR